MDVQICFEVNGIKQMKMVTLKVFSERLVNYVQIFEQNPNT